MILAVVRPTGVYLLDFFYSGIQFYFLLNPNFCSISFLNIDLYVLGDDAWISLGFFVYVTRSTSELRVKLAP